MPAARSPIAARVGSSLDAAPDRVALVDDWRTYRAGEVADLLTAVAAALADRDGRGLRVLMVAPNCAESVILWLATMAAGGLWASVNPRYAAAEQAALVQRFRPTLLVTGEDSPLEFAGAEVVRIRPGRALGELVDGRGDDDVPVPDVDPHAPAVVGFTSGTSGRPRGVLHSQAGLLVSAEANLLIGKPAGALGVVLSTMVLNIMVLGPLQGLLSGRTVVLANRTDGAYLAKWCVDHQVTEIGVPPTIIHDLLDQYDRAGDQRIIPERVETGGAACTPDLQARFHQATGRRLIRAYGLTEAPGTVAMESAHGIAMPQSSGTAMPHVLLSIRDADGMILPDGVEGQICVSAALEGPIAGRYVPMVGYLDEDQSPPPVRGGALYTGDLGRLDGDGRLFVTGRMSSLIIRGGANISPAEVEDVLIGHPAVADAVVFGVPDTRLGETVAAAIVAADGGADPDFGELRDYTARFLARYKVPKDILAMPAIPRNPTGKPDREALLAAWRGGVSDD